MKSVLVTGAGGFIGKHALSFLTQNNFNVHALYSTNKPLKNDLGITWHQLDLHDHEQVTQLMQRIAPSHLFHLAWYAKPKVYWNSPLNQTWLYSSIHLLNQFINVGGTRAVLVGTCAEYDWNIPQCSEYLTPCAPQTLYGKSKLSLYLFSETLAKQHNISLAWARLFFLFGQEEYQERLVPSVIINLLNQKPFNVMNGTQIRDFLFVTDVANALVTLLDSNITGPINIASGKAISIKELTTLIAEKLNAQQYLTYQDNFDEPYQRLTADVSRLFTELRWQPSYSLDNAIDKTIAWWRQQ